MRFVQFTTLFACGMPPPSMKQIMAPPKTGDCLLMKDTGKLAVQLPKHDATGICKGQDLQSSSIFASNPGFAIFRKIFNHQSHHVSNVRLWRLRHTKCLVQLSLTKQTFLVCLSTVKSTWDRIEEA
mmetsp:Transcript_18958/g.35535  ORF Transcript_18958/g.35535 Transcript_18958/m.35535 type:complete len:126 (-) Transcript_18958:35-412(-)